MCYGTKRRSAVKCWGYNTAATPTRLNRKTMFKSHMFFFFCFVFFSFSQEAVCLTLRPQESHKYLLWGCCSPFLCLPSCLLVELNTDPLFWETQLKTRARDTQKTHVCGPIFDFAPSFVCQCLCDLTASPYLLLFRASSHCDSEGGTERNLRVVVSPATRHDMEFFSADQTSRCRIRGCAKRKDWLNGGTDVTKPCGDADHPDCLTRQRTDLKGAFRNWIWKTSSHFLISEEITFVGLALFIQWTKTMQKWLWNRPKPWYVSSNRPSWMRNKGFVPRASRSLSF